LIWLKEWLDIMSRAKADYDAIRDFQQHNQENIRELNPDAIEKSDKIEAFLRSEDPRHELRHIIKSLQGTKRGNQRLDSSNPR